MDESELASGFITTLIDPHRLRTLYVSLREAAKSARYIFFFSGSSHHTDINSRSNCSSLNRWMVVALTEKKGSRVIVKIQGSIKIQFSSKFFDDLPERKSKQPQRRSGFPEGMQRTARLFLLARVPAQAA